MKHQIAQFLKIKLYMDNDDPDYPYKHVYVDFHGIKGVYNFESNSWIESELSSREQWAVETFIEDYQQQFDDNYNNNTYVWIDSD